MHIRGFTSGPLSTNAYLVFDREGGHALLVDAPLGSAKKISQAIETFRLKVEYIVGTHGHWDQMAEAAALQEATGATLCAHAWDVTRFNHPEYSLPQGETLPVKVRPCSPDEYLNDGSTLRIGDVELTVWHTPGHTPGSICLYVREPSVLFSGDTLYRSGVGRTDLPGGNLQQLAASLERLGALPDSTWVYPGHGMPTTIGDERWLLDLSKDVKEA